MRRKLNNAIKQLIILVVIMSVCFSFAAPLTFAAESGKCGDNIKWSFSAGTLIIDGKGEMTNFNEVQFAPWKEFADQIKTVKISKGITSIGSLAFYGCTALQAIGIPNSVEKINDKAFLDCTALRFVDLSDNLKFIGQRAFYNCEDLQTLELPNGLEVISAKAFYLCRSIRSVIIPSSVTQLGAQAFSYCEQLIRVEINAPITQIPEWCFYGCENLTQIKIPSTVTEIGTYAFKSCDSLYTVSYSGNKEQSNDIRNQISEDVPGFKTSGAVLPEELPEETLTSSTNNNATGGFVSQTNTTVRQTDKITLVTIITVSKENSSVGSCKVHFDLTVNGDDAWSEAIAAVTGELSKISTAYSLNGTFDSISLTLFLKNTNTVDQAFLQELSRRKITVEVVAPSGNIWNVELDPTESNDIEKDVDISPTVTEAPKKTNDKLGVEHSYEVEFDKSSDLNANVVIPLPQEVAGTNAFLYQQGAFGKLERVQATVVDSSGNAHFYLSSIEKNSKYIIGINVPGEDTSNVMVPEYSKELLGAVARLEKIDYAASAPRTMFGFTVTQLILSVVGILAFISVIIGISMYQINKNKTQKTFNTKK